MKRRGPGNLFHASQSTCRLMVLAVLMLASGASAANSQTLDAAVKQYYAGRPDTAIAMIEPLATAGDGRRRTPRTQPVPSRPGAPVRDAPFPAEARVERVHEPLEAGHRHGARRLLARQLDERVDGRRVVGRKEVGGDCLCKYGATLQFNLSFDPGILGQRFRIRLRGQQVNVRQLLFDERNLSPGQKSANFVKGDTATLHLPEDLVGEFQLVTATNLFLENAETDTLQTAGGANETFVDDFVRQTQRFENLRTLV